MALKRTPEELDRGQLEMMWDMLMMGKPKSNIPALKELLDDLRQAMIQKTSGDNPSHTNSHYVPLSDVGSIVNMIAIESMCLYLSGDLDRIESACENKEENAYIKKITKLYHNSITEKRELKDKILSLELKLRKHEKE